ncbi:MAG: protein translocase subunit SecD [Lachnospiraceae bacterium]|nr:protein translocase subunit SecD [Lachnospiraceae bacterium]
MKKNLWKSLLTLIILIAFTVFLGYTAIVGWGENKSGSASEIELGLDLAGGVSITYGVVGDENPSASDMSDTIYKLQRRVEQYSTEALVYQQGSNRIAIEIPGVSDANTILTELGQPGTLYFIRQTDADGNANYSYSSDTGNYELTRDLADIIATGDAVLSGTDVASAQATYESDSVGNQEPVVSLSFTTEGTQKFADATTAAFANGESIGIYYDGAFVSVPKVQAAITNGSAVINGMADFEEADKLASTIRIGGLKLELEELQSQVVGAQLGSEAISTSLKAGVVGFGLIAVFMVAIFYLPGLLAVLALALYVFLIVILLVGFELTLTLPGIAGIILSVGMAVDANVIIFSRIREELKLGKSTRSAIKGGFDKALSAIVDGNVTTLIAAAVLGLLGSGSIRGFAQTLALGIVLSMFTALVITRLLLNACERLGAENPKLYGVAKDHKLLKILEKRVVWFALSIVIIVVGFVSMGVNAGAGKGILNFSLDFVGGTSTTINMSEEYDLGRISSDVVPVFEQITGDSNVQTQKVQGSNEIVVKTRTLSQEERVALSEALESNFGINPETIQTETISSTISGEMRRDAVVAVVVALLLMLIYIWFRFRDARFGAAAILALAHDVLIVLTCYAVLRISVGATFIACMLTIVGYSINDTIVIFDRLREYMASPDYKNESIVTIANRSLSDTFSRSLFTSVTTAFTVLSLYVFGVSSIKDFALPMFVGIVAGTYSSICIATPFWYVLRTKIVKKEEQSKSKKAKK